jgi:hypothetical protein
MADGACLMPERVVYIQSLVWRESAAGIKEEIDTWLMEHA